MVESEAKMLSEDVMLGAVMFGHEQMQAVINAITEFAAEVGTPSWDWQAPAADESLIDKVTADYTAAITDAYQIADKMQRQDAVKAVKNAAVEALASDDGWSQGADS